MNDFERGQVNTTAAEVYEEFFLPALFQEWAGPVAEAAQIGPGQHVLDVACGTGVLARTIAGCVGSNGSVIGLDINEGMLAVAERKAPDIDWRFGRAEALPFEDGAFDAVVSQFALMFFDDKVAALTEMMRVLKPGGHLAVAVWDSLKSTPGYEAMVALLHDLFGEETANALRAPFSLGDIRTLRALLDEAGIDQAQISTRSGTARFPSLDAWVHTDIKSWTLADAVDDAQYEQLRNEAHRSLKRFILPDGRIEFAAPAHIASVRKAF